MKLIRCNKCQHRFWDEAEFCPHCTARNRLPLQARVTVTIIAIVVLAATALLIWFVSEQVRNEGSLPELPHAE